MARSPLVCGVL